MKPKNGRTLIVSLALLLSLPNPAQALRPGQKESKAGLEELQTALSSTPPLTAGLEEWKEKASNLQRALAILAIISQKQPEWSPVEAWLNLFTAIPPNALDEAKEAWAIGTSIVTGHRGSFEELSAWLENHRSDEELIADIGNNLFLLEIVIGRFLREPSPSSIEDFKAQLKSAISDVFKDTSDRQDYITRALGPLRAIIGRTVAVIGYPRPIADLGTLQEFKKTHKSNPQDDEVWITLGVRRANGEDIPGAIQAFRNALELNPHNAQAWSLLGLAWSARKDMDQAIQAFNTSLKLNPEDARVWTHLGVARLTQGDAEGAREAFQTALSLDPNNTDAQAELGRAYRALGKAGEGFRTFLEKDPDPPFSNPFTGSAGLEETEMADEAAVADLVRRATRLVEKQLLYHPKILAGDRKGLTEFVNESKARQGAKGLGRARDWPAGKPLPLTQRRYMGLIQRVKKVEEMLGISQAESSAPTLPPQNPTEPSAAGLEQQEIVLEEEMQIPAAGLEMNWYRPYSNFIPSEDMLGMLDPVEMRLVIPLADIQPRTIIRVQEIKNLATGQWIPVLSNTIMAGLEQVAAESGIQISRFRIEEGMPTTVPDFENVYVINVTGYQRASIDSAAIVINLYGGKGPESPRELGGLINAAREADRRVLQTGEFYRSVTDPELQALVFAIDGQA